MNDPLCPSPVRPDPTPATRKPGAFTGGSFFAGFALAALCALPGDARAQQFVAVPNSTVATDITADGNTVVGRLSGGGGFTWDWRTAPSPTPIGGLDVTAVNADGSVIVGTIIDGGTGDEVAARWTQATGWVSLGYLPNALGCPGRSRALDVSADGQTVVGSSWDGCSGRAFVWTQATGMQELAVLGTGSNRAIALSADAQVIGGYAQGPSFRSPALWAPDLTGGFLDDTIPGEIHGMNNDGSVIVGEFYPGSGNGNDAFAYTAATGAVSLGSEDPNASAVAVDVSELGHVIVGYDENGLLRNGWIYIVGLGLVDANDHLASLGLTGTPEILRCDAVSADGSVVVGGMDTGGSGFLSGGFIADISTGPWLNLGGGTVGVEGVPFLVGDGPLTAGSPATLSLRNTPPNAIMLAWLSFTSVPLPAFGGLIHANPYANQFFFFSDAQGEWSATVPWPAGVPAGTEVYFQFLVEDVSTLYTITLSNGVKATTP